MRAPPAWLSVRLILLLSTLMLDISSCSFPWKHVQDFRTLFWPTKPASVLIVIVNPDSPSAMRATEAVVTSSARPRERLVILSSQGGATLASSRAPGSPSVRVPAPPTPLPSHPTSFQKAGYRRALAEYHSKVLQARAVLLAREHRNLVVWARSALARVEAQSVRASTRTASISADLGVAMSDLSSLRQAGLGNTASTVIAIMGVDVTTALSTPRLPASLQSSSVVVDDFAGTINEQAAWQSSIMQSGAARVVVLTPATENQLAPVVEQGLDGAVSDTLTSILFGLGQYQLQAAALPQLRHLLRLLVVQYPHATATINGYTDNLAIAGGNILLSHRRAQALADWLIARGVAAGRLQAFGYGDTDPVAPNTAHGQPLNRRVVVVIDPAVSG
jgi:outer membrane protein OmpA-like peptidoglycan-associated protein